MKLSAVTALFFATAVLAEGFVKIPFQKEIRPRQKLARRQAGAYDEDINLSTDGSVYMFNLTIGTPPQAFRLQLDTGSSDLWVPAANTSACTSQNGGCPGGSFNINASTTAQITIPLDWEVSYGDETADGGNYFTDVVGVGNETIDVGIMQMGLAIVTQDGPEVQNNGRGLVGIGYSSLQSGAIRGVFDPDDLPPAFPDALVKAGIINRAAFSLYLNDAESGEGAVLFGGVDSSKYTGELVALPILPSPGFSNFTNYTNFEIALTSISFTDENGTHPLTDENFAVPALIDSGTGAIVTGGFLAVPCAYGQSDTFISYGFGGPGGPVINVSLAQLITSGLNQNAAFEDGTPACQFNANTETAGSGVILGDAFMQAGYFVYDLENNYMAIAQAKLNQTDEEKVAVIPKGTEIPGATSTNTFTDVTLSAATTNAPPAAATAISTQPLSGATQGIPTFDLGSVTALGTSTATASGSGSSSSSSNSASSIGNASYSMIYGVALALIAFVVS